MASVTRFSRKTVIKDQVRPADLQAVLLSTDLGPMAVVEQDKTVKAIRVGYSSEPALGDALRREFPSLQFASSSRTADLLWAYAAGEVVSFEEVSIDLSGFTPFRQRVMKACRGVGYGVVSNYSELASRAGRPRAYRAVGSTMALNRWPVVIPCHRILRRDGAMGGYSTPRGVALKRAMLAMEARHREQ